MTVTEGISMLYDLIYVQVPVDNSHWDICDVTSDLDLYVISYKAQIIPQYDKKNSGSFFLHKM